MNQLQDQIDAQRLLYSKSTKARVDKVVALLLFGCGLYGLVFGGAQVWSLLLFAFALEIWFDVIPISKWIAILEFRRNPKFKDEYQLTFSRESIHFKTASIDSTLQWTHYSHLIEGPTVFLLMYGKALFTLVPKRVFKSQEEMNAFRALVSEAIAIPSVPPIAAARTD